MIYSYACPSCPHTHDLRLSMTAEHPAFVPCPICDHTSHPCSDCFLHGLKRVWEPARLNLGYRPHLHDQNEQFKFKNL